MVLRLHERESELAAIGGALAAAAGGRGGTLVLHGPAGIGKTSVLEAARAAAQEQGFAVGAARGSELERAYAWGVVRQLLEPRLRGMSSASRERALDGAAALAAPVVLPERAEEARSADGSFGVLHGLYWLLAGFADARPQLLVIDDLHWADAASLRFLAFAANRLDALPVVLLAARRPPGGALEASPGAGVIALTPLSRAATAAVLAEADGPPATAALVAACHVATGGNPLLVRRLAEGLAGSGGADGTAGPGLVARMGPDALAGTVGASLARLGDGPARLARAVAVLEQAPVRTAARLAGLTDADAAAYAEQLVQAGVLRDARPLAFVHPLVRDAVRTAMAAGERARLHVEAGALLRAAGAPVEAVAGHLLHAEPGGDAAVAGLLADAGRRALRSGALEEAAACLGRALEEPPPEAERAALLLDLAHAEHGLARPEAFDHVIAAYEGAADARLRAEAVLALMWAGGPGRQEPAETVAMLETALAGVTGRDRELELRLEALRLTAAFFAPDTLGQALGTAERFADLDGRTEGEAELLLHAAYHRFLMGRPAREAMEPLERALAHAEVVAAIGPESAWLPFATGVAYKADRLDLARRAVDIGLAEAGRRGSAPGFAAVSLWRAWIALREGRAADAEADARAAYDAVPGELAFHRMFAGCCLADVLVDRGALDEAETVLAAIGGGEGSALDRTTDLVFSTRAAFRAARGDAAGALADQLESRRRHGGMTDPDPDFGGWLRLARLLHATGDADAAGREAAAALAWARTWGTPGYVGQALVVAGLLAGGVDGLALLQDAVAELERSPARRELVLALVELGAAMRRRGDRAAAREPLRRALDLATAGGMGAAAERAREELRITGARVRRPEATGLAALTPSERRIVELAAGGASNPEIAQALFVTVKTVEMHLGNAYRKLGVRSRHELPALVAAR